MTKSSSQRNFEVCDGSTANPSYFERFLRAGCVVFDGPEIASSQNRPFNQPLRLAACCRSKTFLCYDHSQFELSGGFLRSDTAET